MKKLWKATKLLKAYEVLWRIAYESKDGDYKNYPEAHEVSFINNMYSHLDEHFPENELTEGQQDNIKKLYQKYILIEW